MSRHKIAAILEIFPSEVIKDVIPLMKRRDPDERFWALKLLSKLGSRGYTKDVEKLARDPSESVRAAVCECLGASGEKESAPYIEEALSDSSWIVRSGAVRALERLLRGAAMNKIMPLINDASLSVIKSVKDAMAANIESVLPYINKILKGEDELAKKVSIEALEVSGHMEKLLRGLTSPDSICKKKSRDILEGILRSRIHDGLVGAILIFRGDERRDILNEIRGMDTALAAEIGNKL